MKRKFLPTYIGPFEVLKVCGKCELNRQIKLTPTLAETAKSDIFHVSKLKMAYNRKELFDTSLHIPAPTKKNADGEDEYYVKQVIAYEERKNGRYYRVLWEGYDDEWDTWEHESLLENAQERVKEFMQNYPQPVNPNRKKQKELKRLHHKETEKIKKQRTNQTQDNNSGRSPRLQHNLILQQLLYQHINISAGRR